jgi:hypothetical protein
MRASPNGSVLKAAELQNHIGYYNRNGVVTDPTYWRSPVLGGIFNFRQTHIANYDVLYYAWPVVCFKPQAQ